MKNQYPNEKFSRAVNDLATSSKPIQERICDAYICNLIHVKVSDLPESIRFEFEEFCSKLTSIDPKGDEGRVAATTSHMSTNEAIEIAQKIVFMADVVRSELEHNYA